MIHFTIKWINEYLGKHEKAWSTYSYAKKEALKPFIELVKREREKLKDEGLSRFE